jgi:hypothetical protein
VTVVTMLGAVVVAGIVWFAACVGDLFEPPMLPEVSRGEGRTEELAEALEAHGLRLPDDAAGITYTTSSSIDLVRLGVRFQTSPEGLRALLRSMDRTDEDLEPGLYPWDHSFPGSPERYGWQLGDVTDDAGLIVERPRPGTHWYAMVVRDRESRPVVHLEAIQG